MSEYLTRGVRGAVFSPERRRLAAIEISALISLAGPQVHPFPHAEQYSTTTAQTLAILTALEHSRISLLLSRERGSRVVARPSPALQALSRLPGAGSFTEHPTAIQHGDRPATASTASQNAIPVLASRPLRRVRARRQNNQLEHSTIQGPVAGLRSRAGMFHVER